MTFEDKLLICRQVISLCYENFIDTLIGAGVGSRHSPLDSSLTTLTITPLKY